MTVLETPVCDITASLITLCSYNDSRIEKDELGISQSFNFESLLCWSLPSDAIPALLHQYFFCGLSSFNNICVCVTFWTLIYMAEWMVKNTLGPSVLTGNLALWSAEIKDTEFKVCLIHHSKIWAKYRSFNNKLGKQSKSVCFNFLASVGLGNSPV